MIRSASILAILFASLVVADDAVPQADEQRAKDQTFLEALARIESLDLNANPKLKTKLLAVLERNRGSETFVELSARFELRDQADELFKLALAKPNESAGVSAAKLLIKFGELPRFEKAIADNAQPDSAKAAQSAITALGFTNDTKAYALLEKIVTGEATSKPIRAAAVAAFGNGRAGEKKLLDLAKTGKLPDDLHFAAGNVLLASSDAAVRAEAARHLKLPPSLSSRPLPPIAELAKRGGDASKGINTFKKVNCVQCHRISPELGADFGPALSEIGSKLPKEGLYTAILDPSAGIEHNYEGTRIETDEGEAVGIVISETKDDLVLRMAGGITQKHLKSAIVGREKLKGSLMPSGLQQAMSEQELVDLVEWLSSLKKK
jgi:putative heme-binding domain-containing protein